MRKYQLLGVALMIGLLGLAPRMASAHCQVPCGIYDDHARVQSMLEDVATIRKAVVQLGELNVKSDVQSRQQFVRWVNTKEQHAENIIRTISDYFLTQRVKADQKDYVQRLRDHHAVMVGAMQCKQSAVMEPVDRLEALVKVLLNYYHEH